MNIVSKLTFLTRFKLEGSVRSFLSTIPGGMVFALAFNIFLILSDPNTRINSKEYPLSYELVLSIIVGMIFSFVPAVIGGWHLAAWIYKNSTTRTSISGMIWGAFAGGISMFGFDILITLFLLSGPHGPSLDMFMFYVITSIIIAILCGAIVGLQLVSRIQKINIP